MCFCFLYFLKESFGDVQEVRNERLGFGEGLDDVCVKVSQTQRLIKFSILLTLYTYIHIQ